LEKVLKPQINIGIIGFGTVGAGTLKVLLTNKADIERRIGSRLEVVKVADLDLTTDRGVDFDKSILTTNAAEVLDNPEIDIVVELIGGIKPAKDFILRALKNGKHVVTANKELIAKEGMDILATADEKGLDFYFEASVGGGIPIIRPLKECLAANRILQVIGIVNGTTNYILTKMAYEGRDFGDVLAEAQAAGYAEADPTSDVEGYDARYKLAILSAIAFTSRTNVNDIYTEGITSISKSDISYARDMGYAIKLLAIARRSGDEIQAKVHPTLIPLTHPLASVNDVFNGIFVTGDFVGDVMFYGRGAGSLPTGSAVAGDVMAIARNINMGATGRLPCTCFDKLRIQPIEETEAKFYIRILVDDRPNVLAKIAGIFGEQGVSIATMVQKDLQDGKAELVIVTHRLIERNFRMAMDEMAKLPVVSKVCNWIRVEE
jgi:homoserine dehydrogenase